MALVIPRGWGHQVDGCDDLSIHCTFAVVRLEVHQLLERIAFEAGCWPSLRADVPFDVHRPARSYAGGVFDQPGGFAAALAEVAGPGRGRPRHRLASGPDQQTVVRAPRRDRSGGSRG